MTSIMPADRAARLPTADLANRLARLPAVAVIGLGLVSAALVLLAIGNWAFAVVFGMTLAGLAVVALMARSGQKATEAPPAEPDWTLLHQALDGETQAVAITDRAGQLICANPRFESLFGGLPAPPALPLDEEERALVEQAARTAWRDGFAQVSSLGGREGGMAMRVFRAGRAEDHLVWQFRQARREQTREEAERLIEGRGGQALGDAGMMAVLTDGEGRLLAANRAFRFRALGRPDAAFDGRGLTDLLTPTADDHFALVAEAPEAPPLRLVQVALEPGGREGAALFLMLDEAEETDAKVGKAADVHALLAMLPLGLALADRDGRFVFMNQAFTRAAGIERGEEPVYPGDLMIDEDKPAVADAVRRHASGRGHPGDLLVRLKRHREEPIALTVARAQGLGKAAVVVSLKDNSEQVKLERQVAQATKMQAVGQLAGGVAHDFNNILTAIIGHCDLMLLRHTPGDSDYDDIQQIKHNSNRAAGLTRQLLAFSRQQTMRPQVLQLPDAVAEVSNLLKRLLGETVTLVVKHGRNLGPVRADPGQLEQVIVNLAVNARDAMPEGGTLTLQTYAVASSEVRRLRSDILPVADYTALSVADTGVGIPPESIGKIFEPFFTTKEVGKGTGLGLSTVYGIVKQSGGYIFADSTVGKGTTFVIYLPVHHAPAAAGAEPARPRPEPSGDLWGSGTVLLVEDEAMVRAVAERALTRQGYSVVTAANGEEALELLETGTKIDLLVSDVVMPSMDGPTLVRHARERFPDLPILFMSGYAEEQLRRSIDLPRVSFLPKPFSVQQLAEAARAAIALV
jgi:two-component system cell cycle sensor histidine kinase/response regulator CckA